MYSRMSTPRRLSSTPERLTLDCCSDQLHEWDARRHEYICASCGARWRENAYVWLAEKENVHLYEVETLSGSGRWVPPTWLVVTLAMGALVVAGLVWWALWLLLQGWS